MSQKAAPGTTMTTEVKVARPIGLWVVIVLSALMFYRIIALTQIPNLGDTIPGAWIVALSGDAFVGITALMVAALLWKVRGLAVWTIGIGWQVIGIKDFTAGMQLLLVEPFDSSFGNVVWVILIGGTVIQLLCIYLLYRARGYFFG